MIPINKPILGYEELDAVRKVIESGILTNPTPEGGPNSKRFEGELATYLGAKHAVVVNSGTAALQLGLLAAGIGSGDEVIVPSFTFIATASAVILLGAKPVFADIDPKTYNMDPKAFRGLISKKTKAVIPVDLYGLPADFEEIEEIAEQRGISVIEDACQAQGASYKGKMAGTLGDLGCFSFYPGKVMTTGEGGAIVTDDNATAEKVRRMRTHGQVKGYDPVVVGGNFRMPEMEAAMGREQLKKLPEFLFRRASNAKELISQLEGSRVQLPFVPKGFIHNWYLFTVRCSSQEKREKLRSALVSAGYGATVYYPTPVHKTSYYMEAGFGKTPLPKTERAAGTVLSMPVNPLVTKEDIVKMAEITKKSQ